MGLQNAFYIIAIVYMSFMFLVTVAVIVVPWAFYEFGRKRT